ncbi:MAG: phosphocholine cytidylyltransferase family protein [Eubacterium sp.]|nr:phosphocholine cytidylyltransferase family protein [Eubacterium sp.]
MRVIILAAGRGTRISRYLAGRPKCTVDIGGISLIEYTIKKLKSKGIHDIAIVLGYNNKHIREKLKDYDISYYENPFYDVTNSIASIWFAKDFMKQEDSYMIMNGDVFLQDELFDRIINEPKSPVMFADGSRKEEADYKFYYENGILKKYGKELTAEETSGEYIGVGTFDFEFIKRFRNKLEEMIRTQQHSVWWENVVYNISESDSVYIEDIKGFFWAEVDYIEDYKRILEYRGIEGEKIGQ